MQNEKIQRLIEWDAAKKALVAAKAAEAEARREVAALFFPEPVEGTNVAPLGNGWEVVLKVRYNVAVDEELFDELLKKARLKPEIAETLDDWQWNLKRSAFEALPDAKKDILAPAVTYTPGMPSLEIREAKDEK